MRRRWDNDERGVGVADATGLLESARELLEAMAEPGWVAEEPEAHLLPHIERACARRASALALESWDVEPDGTLAIELRWTGARRDLRAVWAATYALIGEVAESATYTRERWDGDDVVYDVVTGMLAPDTEFAPHGHVLRVRIRGIL